MSGAPASAAVTKPSRRSRRTLLITLIAVLVVVALVMAFVIIRRHVEESSLAEGGIVDRQVELTREAVYGDYFDANQWDIQDPEPATDGIGTYSMDLTEAGFKKVFDDPHAYSTVHDREDGRTLYTVHDSWRALNLYVDRDLTMPYPVSVTYDPQKGKLLAEGTYADQSGLAGFEGFWAVQRIDKDGNQLKKPILDFYQGDKNPYSYNNKLARPTSVSLGVDSKGDMTIRWPKVGAAAGYQVNLVGFDAHASDGYSDNDSFSTKLASFDDPDKTATSMGEIQQMDEQGSETSREETMEMMGLTEEDKERLKSVDSSSMNESLQFLVRQSQDEAEECQARGTINQCTSGIATWDRRTNSLDQREESDYNEEERRNAFSFDSKTDLAQGWLVVHAVDKDGKLSHGTVISLESIRSRIPLREATYRNNTVAQGSIISSEVSGNNKDIDRQLDAASRFYVTMGDGTTRMAVVELDGDLNEKGDFPEQKVMVPGTTLTNTVTFMGGSTVLDKYKAKLDEVRKSVSTTGLVDAPYAVGDLDIDSGQVAALDVDSQPVGKNGVEKYKPFGSIEYAQYLAENLLAMHRKIDITDYMATVAAPEASNVLDEVFEQNPYLAAVQSSDLGPVKSGIFGEGDRIYLVVTYPEGMSQYMDAMQTKAAQAATQIGTGGADGVRAIEQYLASTTQYDYEAFTYSKSKQYYQEKEQDEDTDTFLYRKYPHAWSDGVLMTGAGVCKSYAIAFDAIADQVGIESLYVTGDAFNEDGSSAGPHAWNRVRIDGTWYDVDATWDDDGDSAGTEYSLIPANGMARHQSDASWMLLQSVASHGGSNNGDADHYE